MYPLTAEELGDNFDIEYARNFGQLPSVHTAMEPSEYLSSYVSTYLREEVLQEGLTRNIETFSRFLETASFSQGLPVNYSEIAREAAINRKTVENYFSIMVDLLLAFTLPVFTRRAKRRLMSHVKFYYFDAGVYRAIRPAGPLDSPEEISGIALETLCFQEILAINDYHRFGYAMYYWRTSTGLEVDFVLYGPLGLIAIEIKHANRISSSALSGVKAFGRDYPEARRYFLYMGTREELREGIHIMPAAKAIRSKKYSQMMQVIETVRQPTILLYSEP